MNTPKIVVVIPTFNEVNNLSILTKKIFSQGIPNLDILIVDDNSPDGTACCARKLSPIYDERIHVLDIPHKLGLANAYNQGFNWAISNLYEIIVQMDADLSHNPIYIREMIDKLDIYDLVIASRYIQNGYVSNNWSFLRKLISSLGNFGIRKALSLNVRDVTSGFKAFNYRTAKSINWDKIRCSGFGFQSEVTFQCVRFGYSVFEMPILFDERLHDKSKMTFTILLETLVKIIEFRLFHASKFKKTNISNP